MGSREGSVASINKSQESNLKLKKLATIIVKDQVDDEDEDGSDSEPLTETEFSASKASPESRLSKQQTTSEFLKSRSVLAPSALKIEKNATQDGAVEEILDDDKSPDKIDKIESD